MFKFKVIFTELLKLLDGSCQLRFMTASLGNCSPELDGKFFCDLTATYEFIDLPSIRSGQPHEFLRSDSSLTLFDGGHCRPSESEVFGHILLGETASLSGVLKAS